MAEGRDPLIDIVLNQKFIDIASTLMAKLDYIQYDEARTGVFKTKWGKQFYSTCVKKLSPTLESFDVDKWYAGVIAKREGTGPDTRINPSYGAQPLTTNWLLPLFEMESRAYGFMQLLHNILELEEKAHEKLSATAKQDMEYDFFGVGPQNAALPKCLEGPQVKLLKQ